MEGMEGIPIDYDAIRNALRVKTRKRGCPACEFEGGWDGASELVLLDVANRESKGNGTPPKPDEKYAAMAVLINCPNCGYTETYNLVALLGEGQDASGR